MWKDSPRSEDFPLESGMIFEVEVPERGYVPGMILEVTGDEVKIKYGHPLAGQTIHFIVEVIALLNFSKCASFFSILGNFNIHR